MGPLKNENEPFGYKGNLLEEEYGFLYEKALIKVYKDLKNLWTKYSLDFNWHLEDHSTEPMISEFLIFSKAILMESTRHEIYSRLQRNYCGRGKVSKGECDWPIIKCDDQKRVLESNSILIGYIKMTIVRSLMYWADIKLKGSLEKYRRRLFELIHDDLFRDNLRGAIIEKCVINTVLSACEDSDYGSMNTRLREKYNKIDSQVIMDIIDPNEECSLVYMEQAIDSATLHEARKTLIKNQNRLIVEEEDNASGTNIKPMEFSTSDLFTNDEIEFISRLLNGESLSEMDSKSKPLVLLADGINVKAVDIIGDTIIDNEDGYCLVDDYIDEIKMILEESN
jgi:hypothetical protein